MFLLQEFRLLQRGLGLRLRPAREVVAARQRGYLSEFNRGQYLRRVVKGVRLPGSFVGVLVRSFLFQISLKLLLCTL